MSYAREKGAAAVRALNEQNRRKDQAMATLMNLPPAVRVRCAAGLPFTAAAEARSNSLLIALGNLSSQAEQAATALVRESEERYREIMTGAAQGEHSTFNLQPSTRK